MSDNPQQEKLEQNDRNGMFSGLSEYAPYHHHAPERAVYGSSRIEEVHDRVSTLQRVLEENEEFYERQWGDDE